MKKLAEKLKRYTHVMAFTGAGMDTESNLPDFRGPEGLWKNHDPRTLASTQAMKQNYGLFHEFYSYRAQALQGVSPHPGHFILAKWEEEGLIKGIITQNVSGLHQAAGSQRVIELHGRLRKYSCEQCQQKVTEEAFFRGDRCSCGGFLRPGVVLFGEGLPQKAFEDALDSLQQTDGLLILGTSLEVYPAAQLPFMYPMDRYYVGLEPVAKEAAMTRVFHEKIGAFLKEVDHHLSPSTP